MSTSPSPFATTPLRPFAIVTAIWNGFVKSCGSPASRPSIFATTKIDGLDAGDPHDFTKPFQIAVTIAKGRSGVVANGEGDVLIPIDTLPNTFPEILRNYQP